MERRFELIDYIGVLVRWWRFILGGTVFLTALAVLATFLTSSYYATEASVLVVKSKVAEEGKDPSHTYTPTDSYVSLLENNTIFLEAIERFGLRQAPYTLTLRSIQRLWKVRLMPKTDLLSVSFSFPDAELCQKIARFVIDRAIEHNRELNRAEAIESRSFLAEELSKAKAHRDEIQSRLLELRKASDAGTVEGLRNAALRNVASIDELRRRVESEVANGEAAVVEAGARVAAIPPKVELRSELSRSPTYQQIVSRIADSQLAQLLGAPFLVEDISEAHENAKSEMTRVSVKLAGDRAQLARLNESLADLEAKAEQWNQEFAARREAIKDLSDQYEAANKVYEQLAIRYNEATVTVGSRSQDLRLVDAPYLPERRSWPERGLVALIAGQMSLVLLALAAFLLDYVARRRSRL